MGIRLWAYTCTCTCTGAIGCIGLTFFSAYNCAVLLAMCFIRRALLAKCTLSVSGYRIHVHTCSVKSEWGRVKREWVCIGYIVLRVSGWMVWLTLPSMLCRFSMMEAVCTSSSRVSRTIRLASAARLPSITASTSTSAFGLGQRPRWSWWAYRTYIGWYMANELFVCIGWYMANELIIHIGWYMLTLAMSLANMNTICQRFMHHWACIFTKNLKS